MSTEQKLNGKIVEISETQNVSDKFSKRNLVLTTNGEYPDTFQLEFQKDKTSLLDKFNVGDQVEVNYNLRGRGWTNKDGKTSYFTTLVAWKIGVGEADNYAPALVEDDNSTLPF